MAKNKKTEQSVDTRSELLHVQRSPRFEALGRAAAKEVFDEFQRQLDEAGDR